MIFKELCFLRFNNNALTLLGRYNRLHKIRPVIELIHCCILSCSSIG